MSTADAFFALPHFDWTASALEIGEDHETERGRFIFHSRLMRPPLLIPPAPLPAAAESTAESAGAPFAVTYGEQGSPLRASGPVWNCDLVSSLSAAGSAGTKGDEGDAGRDGGVGGG